MPEVVVYLLEGRTLEQKRGLVKDITQAVIKNAGTSADQVTVSLVETPKTAKAKGGVLFSEMPRALAGCGKTSLRPSRCDAISLKAYHRLYATAAATRRTFLTLL